MDVEDLVEEVMEKVSAVGDDSSRLSQQDSIDFYESVAEQCRSMARAIREDMGV